ncbi:MAG: threonine/homoserine/homoserine lactone efflux protein [Marinoscillum sp.]|jgi:threonine/homoserine/homoserine lactone efflux protein
MPPFIKGLLFGLIFIFSFGPSFFTLIQTSIQKGYKRAISVALGFSLSDITYVVLALLGLGSILEDPEIRFWVGLVGVVVLITFGITLWVKPPTTPIDNDVSSGSDKSLIKYFMKGFLINAVNPFIIIFWLGVIGIVAANYEFTMIEKVYFFSGMLITILSADLGKALVAYRLRSMLTIKRIAQINKVVAVVLILFGCQIIYFLISNYWL